MAPLEDRSELIYENYQKVKDRVLRAGGSQVSVVAVSKRIDVDVISKVNKLGIVDFGENYPNELLEKATVLSNSVLNWHMIGAIQSRRIPSLAGVVGVWHSVSRIKELELLAANDSKSKLFLQVDYSKLQQRSGFAVSEVEQALKKGLSLSLNVVGLMTITPVVSMPERIFIFRDLYQLGRSLDLSEFSMGMTDDFEAAVSEGSTIVRVGRAIFGDREIVQGKN